MPRPRPALFGLRTPVWPFRGFSHNLLQSSLRGLDASPTSAQDVGNADGEQRTSDRAHDVDPVVGKVPEHQVRTERARRIHRCPTDWAGPESRQDDVCTYPERRDWPEVLRLGGRPKDRAHQAEPSRQTP